MKDPDEKTKPKPELRVILQGTSGAGKSTLLFQLKEIYEGPYSEGHREHVKPLIYNFIISNIRRLIEQGFKENNLNDIQDIAQRVLDTPYEELSLILRDVETVWLNDEIQFLWMIKRFDLNVSENIPYFMDKFHRLANPFYVPTSEDMLRAKLVTTVGVVEKRFDFPQANLTMFDFGGRRCERKKLIYIISSFNALIFVVSVSEFDQISQDDDRYNQVEDSMEYFATVCACARASQTSIILLLNKVDLLRKKIEYLQNLDEDTIVGSFGDYHGPSATTGLSVEYMIEAVCEHIKSKFLSIGTKNNVNVYPFTLSAIDKGSTKEAFDEILELLVHLKNQPEVEQEDF